MVKYKRYVPVASSWVWAVADTCDCKVVGAFRSEPYGPVSVHCLYPGVPDDYFDFWLASPSKGRFQWHVLPYRQPYSLVNGPGTIGCATTCAITFLGGATTVTIRVTVTNIDGTCPPVGTVQITADGVTVCTGVPVTPVAGTNTSRAECTFTC